MTRIVPVRIVSETRIQTCVTNTCRIDTCQESVEMFERNTKIESLPDDTCIEIE